MATSEKITLPKRGPKMYMIRESSYFKPYEDDTGFAIDSSPNLTAIISDLVQEIEIDIPRILSEPFVFSEEELIDMADKNDYRPLLDSDPTDEF